MCIFLRFFVFFFCVHFWHFLLPPIVEVDISDIAIISGITNMVRAIISGITNTPRKTYRIAQYTDSWNRLHSLGGSIATYVCVGVFKVTLSTLFVSFEALAGLLSQQNTRRMCSELETQFQPDLARPPAGLTFVTVVIFFFCRGPLLACAAAQDTCGHLRSSTCPCIRQLALECAWSGRVGCPGESIFWEHSELLAQLAVVLYTAHMRCCVRTTLGDICSHTGA